MAFDPFLYVALAAGLLAGAVVRPRSPWVGRATLASVVVLVGLLGASLAPLSAATLLLTIPVALGLLAAMLAVTTALALGLRRFAPRAAGGGAPPAGAARFPFSGALVFALAAGYGAGRLVALPVAAAIPFALYALLALVGFGLRLTIARLPTLWIPVTAALGGATVAGLGFAAVTGTPLGPSLAATFGFGFYSLAGPLVAARAGAALGLLAFLTNFFRENVTMVLAPVVGRRLGGDGLTAWGGATSMDTTLYFITRYGDADAATLALASGLLLTIVATVALPALLSAPV